tara:strand:+ start:116 stop:1012 length:897 start_codon:yes stop_codon:yes gene_type:complete
MINICCYCNPIYTNKSQLQSTYRKFDVVSQFVCLYNSIKKNWNNCDYKINVICNKNLKWSESDIKRIENLDISIIYVDKPDIKSLLWQTRLPCFSHPLKYKGTHRLVIDCDTIALNNPEFDLSCDWQAMYASYCSTKQMPNEHRKYICDYLNYDFDLKKKYKYLDSSFKTYNTNSSVYEDIYPYFNAGAILIKEELCKKYAELIKPGFDLYEKQKWGNLTITQGIKHIFLQYVFSYALIHLSKNWKPFNPGINFMPKDININQFGIQNIQLLHYAGCSENSRKNIFKEVKKILNDYID